MSDYSSSYGSDRLEDLGLLHSSRDIERKSFGLMHVLALIAKGVFKLIAQTDFRETHMFDNSGGMNCDEVRKSTNKLHLN